MAKIWIWPKSDLMANDGMNGKLGGWHILPLKGTLFDGMGREGVMDDGRKAWGWRGRMGLAWAGTNGSNGHWGNEKWEEDSSCALTMNTVIGNGRIKKWKGKNEGRNICLIFDCSRRLNNFLEKNWAPVTCTDLFKLFWILKEFNWKKNNEKILNITLNFLWPWKYFGPTLFGPCRIYFKNIHWIWIRFNGKSNEIINIVTNFLAKNSSSHFVAINVFEHK